MHPDVQAFLDTWQAKSAAKVLVMEALGRAKLAELHGEDASADWAIVAEQGVDGEEGRLQAEAQALADAYVKNHPETFAGLDPDLSMAAGHDKLMATINACRNAPDELRFIVEDIAGRMGLGLDDVVPALTMFELVYFDRVKAGVTMRMVVERPQLRGLGTVSRRAGA